MDLSPVNDSSAQYDDCPASLDASGQPRPGPSQPLRSPGTASVRSATQPAPSQSTQIQRDQRPPSGPPAQRPAEGGPLSGVTTQELDHLSRTYQIQTQPNGRPDVSMYANDTSNAQKLTDATEQDFTGYPHEVARFEQRSSSILDQLAALPASESTFYAASAATFNSAYRMATSEGCHEIDRQYQTLEDAIRKECNRAINDPLERVMATFNTPVGAGYLDKAREFDVSQLARMRNDFMTATTPQGRESTFKAAVTLKHNLQARISTAIDTHRAQQSAEWKEADDDVDRMLKEADAIVNDPGKRYELIARQLYTSNPGRGQDAFADRRMLAFTQRMQVDPALRDKLSRWQGEAASKLNSYGVGGPKRYQDILNDLPPAGPDYVHDLAGRYNAILKDATEKHQSITPEERAKRVAGQILEGTARFLLGMTPLAPLTSALDERSTLSPSARLGVDVASNLLSLVIDPTAVPGRVASRANLFKLAVKNIDELADTGKAIGTAIASGAADVGGQAAPLAPAVAHVGIQQRIAGRPMLVPRDYAVDVKPGSLRPAPGNRPGEGGTLTGEGGQHYVKIGDDVYPVRHDKDDSTWWAYDRDNPWRPSYPLSLDSNNQWQVHSLPGLRGGMMQPGTSSAPPISPALQTALEVDNWASDSNQFISDPNYVSQYRTAFANLSPAQQKALKGWSYVDVGSDTSPGSSSGSGSTGDKNYDLNRALYGHTPYPGMDADVKNLTDALSLLPPPSTQDVHLIRVADVPLQYSNQFKPGDLVTNSPAFMSASSGRDFAQNSLWEGGATAGSNQGAIAIYDIRALSAKPFIPGINTRADDEAEWLFRPNTVFRVDEVAVRPPTEPGEKPRIGVRLTEVPVTDATVAKNIHSGQSEVVHPGIPNYAELTAVPWWVGY